MRSKYLTALESGAAVLGFTITPKYRVNKYLYVKVEGSYLSLNKKGLVKNNKGELTDSEVGGAFEIGFVF